MTTHYPFKYFKTSSEIIRLAVIMYIWFSLSLRNVGLIYKSMGAHELLTVKRAIAIIKSKHFFCKGSNPFCSYHLVPTFHQKHALPQQTPSGCQRTEQSLALPRKPPFGTTNVASCYQREKTIEGTVRQTWRFRGWFPFLVDDDTLSLQIFQDFIWNHPIGSDNVYLIFAFAP